MKKEAGDENKRRKVLVPFDEYLQHRLLKPLFFALGISGGMISLFTGGLGILCVFLSFCWFLMKGTIIPILYPGLCLAVASTLFFLMSKFMLTESKRMGSVELLTDSILEAIPAEEVLVRSSDNPDVEQESFLLRSVVSGVSTPQEQLLRAGIDPRQEAETN